VCGIDGPAPEAAARQLARAIAEAGNRTIYAGCRVVASSTSDEFDGPVASARLSASDEPQTGGRMRVLVGGIAIDRLTVARARMIMRRLAEQCEYVVIAAASPTVEPATMVIAELADTTVLVAQHGVTRLRAAEQAGTRLRRVGGAVFGVLVDLEKPGPINESLAPPAGARVR